MNVELVRWPSDPQRLADLRDQGVPRLLLVTDGSEPPVPSDCLEDWVAAGAPNPPSTLGGVPSKPGPAPTELDPRSMTTDCCVTTTRGCRCHRSSSRSPGHCSTGSVRSCPADMLAGRAWPDGAPTRNALDVHVLRLRRRLVPLGSRSGPCACAATCCRSCVRVDGRDRDDGHRHLALRSLVRDGRAGALAEDRLSDRRFVDSTSYFSWRSSIEPTRYVSEVVVAVVAEVDERARLDHVAGGVGVDHDRVLQHLLELADPGLVEAVLVLGRVVVGVLLDVAVLAGAFDRRARARAGASWCVLPIPPSAVRGPAGERWGSLMDGQGTSVARPNPATRAVSCPTVTRAVSGLTSL